MVWYLDTESFPEEPLECKISSWDVGVFFGIKYHLDYKEKHGSDSTIYNVPKKFIFYDRELAFNSYLSMMINFRDSIKIEIESKIIGLEILEVKIKQVEEELNA